MSKTESKGYESCNWCGKIALKEDIFNGRCLSCVDHYESEDEPPKLNWDEMYQEIDSQNGLYD